MESYHHHSRPSRDPRDSDYSHSSKKSKTSHEHGSTSHLYAVPYNNHSTTNGFTIIRKEMCFFCFDVLHSHLNAHEPPKAPTTFPNLAFPLFVTWKIGKEKKLRGCIGTFAASKLHQGLKEYALSSAVNDSRFKPISKDEIAKLHCSVSILTNFEEARDYQDWDLGVHGIRIEFYNERGQKKSATYLPEVATEQGWNKVQTIDSLLWKGGYRNTVTEEFRRNIKLTRYRSEKLTVSHAEYSQQKQNGYYV